MIKEKKDKLSKFYRDYLLNKIMPFWEERTLDKKHGGYLTCFDREGKLITGDKCLWIQGRQLWMFSALYNQVEKRPAWLELAREGRDFLVRHAYAGKGRWFYQLDREGKVNQPELSFYTDGSVLMGLCEFALAAQSDEDTDLIEETFHKYEQNFNDPDFNEYYHFIHDPRYNYHGKYMISLNLAALAERLLGPERTRPLIDHCLQQILHVFAKDEHEALFEAVGKDGQFANNDQGRIINPGHVLESMWFCMTEGRRRKDQSIIDRCIQICNWAYQSGYDKEYGGIFALTTTGGYDITQSEYYRKNCLRFDSAWDHKAWWVHAEALYALLFAAILTDNAEFFDRFYDLHQWCWDKFYDKEYGEWYQDLYRDGTPKHTNKGAAYKGAFHLPRALMLITLLLEENTKK